MTLLDVMHTYFRGEKLEALLFILRADLALLGLAVAACRSESGGFMRGAVVPAVLFGLVLAGTGIGLVARTPG